MWIAKYHRKPLPGIDPFVVKTLSVYILAATAAIVGFEILFGVGVADIVSVFVPKLIGLVVQREDYPVFFKANMFVNGVQSLMLLY